MTTSERDALLEAVAVASKRFAESRTALREAIVAASLRGFSQAEIAAAAGFTRQWIGRIVQNWREEHDANPRPKAS